MNSILSLIQRFFSVIFLYIFTKSAYTFRRLRFAGRGVPLEDKINDFYDIFKNTLLFLFFNLIAFFVFTVLPQGKDILLIVIEDLSNYHPWSLISLLSGLLGWCIVSEFGARYKIYISDNSGMLLTDERVNFRKEAQKMVSSIYLLLPVVIVMFSFIIVSFNNIKKWDLADIWPFILVLLLLVLVFALLSKYYLDNTYITELQKKGVWYKVDKKELNWANKLYGIYNNYVFMVRKATNFKDAGTVNKEKLPDPPPDINLSNTYKRFTGLIDGIANNTPPTPPHTIESFPRDYLIESELPPDAFTEVEFKPDNLTIVPIEEEESNANYVKVDGEKEFKYKKSEDGYYRWIYTNNPAFFKTLHLQVKVIAISSFIFMLLVSSGYLITYEVIGSPALVCLAFACWLGIYTGLLYIDSRYRRKFKVSVRGILLCWFLIVSAINADHPVRQNCKSFARPTLQQHFDAWSKNHLTDTNKAIFINKRDTITVDSSYPVFFITAEGGALRTGAFTAMLLAKLQDSLKYFKDHIYAFSSVSGGSVGIGFFNAVNYLQTDTQPKNPGYYQAITRTFFEQDQLAAPVAKLFYADLLNDFWPIPVERFDRAIALEKTWENSYETVFKRTRDDNVFGENFLQNYTSQKNIPAWFINTTEVETGLQCYISNVFADSFVLATQRDLLLKKIKCGINYSTAINFSTRFPLFSPSAALYQTDKRTFHYVDGGYVENTGSKTMLEILQSLHDSILSKHIKPYVIQLKFSDADSAAFKQTGFLNELTSILSGIYNTRAGASDTYTEYLKKEVKNLNGEIINVPLPASNKDVPMSWVFSKRSLDNLQKVVNDIIKDKNNELNKKLSLLRLK